MKSCENCEWHNSLGYGWKQIKGKLWCTLPENLFSSESPCKLWQKQEYSIPRGEWRGPTWNY